MFTYFGPNHVFYFQSVAAVAATVLAGSTVGIFSVTAARHSQLVEQLMDIRYLKHNVMPSTESDFYAVRSLMASILFFQGRLADLKSEFINALAWCLLGICISGCFILLASANGYLDAVGVAASSGLLLYGCRRFIVFLHSCSLIFEWVIPWDYHQLRYVWQCFPPTLSIDHFRSLKSSGEPFMKDHGPSSHSNLPQ